MTTLDRMFGTGGALVKSGVIGEGPPMPPYRFTWTLFDDDTVLNLAREFGWSGESRGDAEPFLAARVARPSPEFVRRTRRTIEDCWLTKHEATARAIVERLKEWRVGPGDNPRSLSGYLAFIRECRNSSRLQAILADALIGFGNRDRTDDGELDPLAVRRFGSITPKHQPPDTRKPYACQLDAWDKLTAHLAEAERTGVFQGLLVMPTGAGKTFTAANWLLTKVINQGAKVIWIAHRTELLNQAARAFYRAASLVTTRERLRVRLVSSDHCKVTDIDPEDDVLICSIGSLGRRPEVYERLLADPKRFVVIDEAHHAVADTYQDVLGGLLTSRRRRILGLTATPTRTAERERPMLAKMFGSRVLFDIPIRGLIESGILARPIPMRVKTHADAEQGLTAKSIEHLHRFGDLDDEWLKRIAGMAGRNETIVSTYVDNRAKFGKTLVFAINVEHAAWLAETFRDRGISANYVASYRPVPISPDSNEEILERFREPNGGLDVLVNVQILTEGVDVPAVQSVFLTRPTTSEILLRQMIGRGLRGPKTDGGTATAYIVSFEDHWERFRDWESQLALVPDILEAASIGKEDPTATPPDGVLDPLSDVPVDLIGAIPLDLMREVLRSLRAVTSASPARLFEAIPHGSYVLERDVDDELVRHIIPVYEHHEASWNALIAALAGGLAVDHDAIEPLWDEYFGDVEPPAPSLESVRSMVIHFGAGGRTPPYEAFSERSQSDPTSLAQRIVDKDMGERDRKALVTAAYGPLARAIYPTLRAFLQAVNDAILALDDSEDALTPEPGFPVFDPGPDQQLSPGNHDLTRLMQEMLERGASVLGSSSPLHFNGTVEWSRRLIKGWFAKAYWTQQDRPGNGIIRVNKLLNSSDVSEATLRSLLWHEYMHLYLQVLHTPQFRKLERAWPGVVDADREMDTLDERFNIRYWKRHGT